MDAPSSQDVNMSLPTLKTVYVMDPREEAYYRTNLAEHMSAVMAHIEAGETQAATELSPIDLARNQILKLMFSDGRRIAVKILDRDDDTPPPTMLNLIAAAGWPVNVVRYHIVLDMPEHRLVLMDHCIAGDLELEDGVQSPFSEDGLRCIMQGALLGLHSLHNCCLVHCDIKTSNLLCDEPSMEAFCAPNIDADTRKRLSASIKLVDLSESHEFGKLRGDVGTSRAPEIWKEICEYIQRDGSKTWTAEEVAEAYEFNDLCPAAAAEDSFALGVAFYELVQNTDLFDADEVNEIVATGNYDALCKYYTDRIAGIPGTFKDRGLSDAAINFAQRLLNLESSGRPVARDALNDDWFAGF